METHNIRLENTYGPRIKGNHSGISMRTKMVHTQRTKRKTRQTVTNVIGITLAQNAQKTKLTHSQTDIQVHSKFDI